MKSSIFFLVLLCSVISWGQSIVTNPISGTNPNTANPYTVGQVINPNITVSGIGRGTGISGSNANNRYNANNWSTTVLDLNDYFEFTIIPNSGFQINFASFTYTSQVSSGTASQVFRSSLDGFTSNIGSPTTTGTTISLTGAAYQNVTTAITFRIYSFGLAASGTTFSINDFTFNGFVTSTTGCSTPINPASSLTISAIGTTTANFSWTNANGSTGTVVTVRPTTSSEVAPLNLVNYAPNADYSSAVETFAGSGNKVVYLNAGTSSNTIGLISGTQYTATVYSYNTPNCYFTVTPDTKNFYTLANEPSAHATFLSCSTITTSQINLNFSAANTIPNANGYMILYGENGIPTGIPTDGVYFPTGTTFGNSTVAGYTSGSGTDTTFNILGLNGGTTYYFMLVPFGSNMSIAETLNYKTTGTIPVTSGCITSVTPEINIKGIIGTNPSIVDGDVTPQGTDNTLFTTVVVGSSQTKTFRIQNLGNALLSIASITMIGGTAPSDFVVSGITVPTTIAAGGSLDFVVTFMPSASGIRNTTITITNNDSNENPYDYVIQGTGIIVPSIDMNVKGNGQSIPDNNLYPIGTNFTAFGVATVGVTTITKTYTIENLGFTDLTLTGSPLVSITGPHASLFTVTVQPSTAIVLGGSSITFEVTFNPTSPGAKNATIVIANDDPDENPYNFNINGTAKGTNNIYVYGNGNDINSGVATTSLTNLTNFGSQAVISGVKQNTFVITNLSAASRYFSNITISGPDAVLFSVIAQPSNNAVGTGNSTSFTINFTPTSVGNKNATVIFSSFTDSARTLQDINDPPTYTFAISGIGSDYAVCTIGSTQTIAQQDFETNPAQPILGYSYETDGSVTLAGGTFDNGSGPKNAFIGSKSFQFSGIGITSVKTTVLTLNAVDVSQFENINLSIKIGAFRTGSTQGLDINDFVQVESSVDGGINWSSEAVLRAYSNSRWDFDATGVFNAYYTGTNNGPTIDSRNGNAELPNGYATFNVKNLPSVSNLLLRMTLTVDRNDEIWAIDNIKIEGQVPQITTWDGTSWSAGFPTSTMKAVFDGNYTTSALTNQGSIQACECQINSGKIVTIGTGYYIEIQSKLTNDGILNVANNASLIQVNDNALNSGIGITNVTRTTASYELYDYTYWSSPILNPSLNSALGLWRLDYSFLFNTANFQDIITASTGVAPADSFDDNGDAWQHVYGSDLMIPGVGYAVMAPTLGLFPTTTNAVFSGKPNNGVVTIPMVLSQNVANSLDDYNLIGNPYPSAIFADTFISANTDISGTLYFWTHIGNISSSNPGPDLYNFNSDDYAMYNLSGGTAASNTGSTMPTGYIASGQGFFVEAITANDVIFNNSMRNKTYSNHNFYRPISPILAQVYGEKSRIWLNLQNPDGMFSQQLVAYTENSTLGYDRGYDGIVNLSNNYISFYSFIDNDLYRIQARSAFDLNDLVPLGFFSAVSGSFTISINSLDGIFENQNVYLQDNELGIVHDLTQSPYSFTAHYGNNNERFVLRYTTALENENFENSSNNVVLATSNNQITIKSPFEKIASVTIFDILGREIVRKENVSENEIIFNNIALKNQTLIVKIQLQNGEIVTRKIII